MTSSTRFQIKNLAGVTALTVALTMAGLVPAQAGRDRAPYSGVVAFGDSLTDTGNLFALTGQPPAPYFAGRFSNGRVWVEYFIRKLKLKPRTLTNYAVGGAATGRDNTNDIPGVAEFPGLQDQIDRYEATLRKKKRADRRALHVVFAGANDFILAGATPQDAVAPAIANTVTAVQRLHRAGARHIMVVNLPDLGLTPFGQGNAAALSGLTDFYNQQLANALDQLRAAGIRTTRLDSAQILRDIAASPSAFGFSNVTDAFLPPLGTATGDPSDFLFWDAVHPTTGGHEIVASRAKFAVRVHIIRNRLKYQRSQRKQQRERTRDRLRRLRA